MRQNVKHASKTELPCSVERFLAYVAAQSAMYDNCLNYRERDKIKAAMMNCPSRWRGVTADQIRTGCLMLGMTKEDAEQIAYFRQRVVDGHRLKPKYYSDFIFENKCENEYVSEPIKTSMDW